MKIRPQKSRELDIASKPLKGFEPELTHELHHVLKVIGSKVKVT